MKRKIAFVEVDGECVVTMSYYFEQMQAQSCRIDHAIAMARIAIVIGICTAIACAYIILQLRH